LGRFNANREGELALKTHGTVVSFDPGCELAFRMEENWAIWSFRIEETEHGTAVLTQRREAPRRDLGPVARADRPT
jgi:hypothetical protein